MDNMVIVDFKPEYKTKQIISKHLLKLGVSTERLGYEYLMRAIYEVLNKRELIHQTTTVLYHKVARQCETTSSRVERNIRHAIETAFDVCACADGWGGIVYEYFGNSIDTVSCKPTNAQFIASVAEKIKFDAYVAAEEEALNYGSEHASNS